MTLISQLTMTFMSALMSTKPADISGSEERNGTYNMMGNAWEWVEDPFSGGYKPSSGRIFRGGSAYISYRYLESAPLGYNTVKTYESSDLGFRVAAIVPEPFTLILLGAGALLLRKKT